MAWGTLRLVALRTQPDALSLGEGVWGFGQTLPILLSVLPLWSIYSSIYGEIALSSCPKVKLIPVEIKYCYPDPTQEQLFLPQHEERPVQADVLNEFCRSSWFYRLIALMFGFAMVILTDILYTFSLVADNQRFLGLRWSGISGRRILHAIRIRDTNRLLY